MRYFILISLVAVLLACNSGENTTNSATAASASVTPENLPAPGNFQRVPRRMPEMPAPKLKDAESPKIEIKIRGARAGMASLVGIYADQQYREDSAMVNNLGEVTFKRNDPYPRGFYYVLLPDRSNFQLLVDHDQTFSMESDVGNLMGNMKVKGNIDTELYYETKRFEDGQRADFQRLGNALRAAQRGTPEYEQLKAQQDALTAQRKEYLEGIFAKHPDAFFTAFKIAGKNPEIEDQLNPDGTINNAQQVWLYRTKFWEEVNFNDERLLRTPVIANKLKRYINELTPQHPDSITSAAYFLIDHVPPKSEYYKYFVNWVLLNYDPLETTLMDPQAVFTNIVQKYCTYQGAFWTDSVEVFALQQRAYEMAASLVGRKGPDVKAPNPQGQLKSIYEIEAPYVVVYMYNPECEHCAKETPLLVEFYKEWKNQGVEVFAIAIDTDDAEWKDYIAKNKMQDWINVFDPTNKSIYAKYFVDHTPEIYVLNPDRTIIAKNLKTSQIEEMINRDRVKG